MPGSRGSAGQLVRRHRASPARPAPVPPGPAPPWPRRNAGHPRCIARAAVRWPRRGGRSCWTRCLPGLPIHLLPSAAPAGETRERRRQAPRGRETQLLATAPNQVWSWDITKLLGRRMDLLLPVRDPRHLQSLRGRAGCWPTRDRTPGRRADPRDRGPTAASPGQPPIHSDRGPSMTSQPWPNSWPTLGITKSHSRPHVSNDNPFSESQFKTLKYRPDFPDRFPSIEVARIFCRSFFPRTTRSVVTAASACSLLRCSIMGKRRKSSKRESMCLLKAYEAHPERFVRGIPLTPGPLPKAAWINPPDPTQAKAHRDTGRRDEEDQAGADG